MRHLVGLLLLLTALIASAVSAPPDPVLLTDTGSLTVELHPAADASAPLLVYVTGGFWRYDEEQAYATARGSVRMRQLGLAVAMVRLRNDSTPQQWLSDLAALAARFKKGGDGLEPQRLYLLGHSSGALFATLLPFATDTLRASGLSAADIDGVISLAGIHDLEADLAAFEELHSAREQAFGADAAAWQAVSPVRRLSADRPSFLFVSPERDLKGLPRSAHGFAVALGQLKKGHVTYQVAPGTTHLSIADLGDENNFATRLVLAMTGVRPLDRHFSTMVAVHNTVSLYPHFDVEALWQTHADLLQNYPVDRRLREQIHGFISVDRHQLSVLPLERYTAIPLAALARRLDPEARFLVTRNVRNERYHWPVEDLERYAAVLVLGIDHERNLFRFGVPYQAKREYSWIDPERPLPMMHRGLGGFVFFRKRPPQEAMPRFTATFSIDGTGLSTAQTSPLEEYDDLPEALIPSFTWRNGCFSCHRIRGIGSRSFHNRAADGAPHGGYAIDLEDYPPDVWKRFVFEQRKAAAMIGANPNIVEEAVREAIFEHVNQARESRNRKATSRQTD